MKQILHSGITIFIGLFFTLSLFGQSAEFTYSVRNSCAPTILTFTNISDITNLGDCARFDWNLNGIPFTGYEPPEQSIDQEGYYHYYLALWDNCTGSFISDMGIDLEFEKKIDTFKIIPGLEACPGENMHFWVDEDYFNLQWDFGDASIQSDQNFENHPNHTYYIPGTYNVTLIAENNCGIDTIVQQVTITDAAMPVVRAYTSSWDAFCPNEEVGFDVQGQFESYLWDFGDGTTSTEQKPFHFYDTQVATSYTITVEVTNMCGNSNSDTLILNIVDTKPAEASFHYYWDNPFEFPCPNTPVHFFPHQSGFYEWDFGDGKISTGKEPVNLYSVPGIYPVTLTIANGCGGVATYTDTVIVNTNEEDVPFVEFMFDIPDMDWDERMMLDTLRICPGELVQFENNSYSSSYTGEDIKFLWDFGDGQTAKVRDVSHVYTGAGIKKVTLTGTTLCGGSTSMNRYVWIDPGLQPSASLGAIPLEICDGEKVFFFDEGRDIKESNYVYDIDFGDGTSMNNITYYTDTILRTIASHAYTGTPGTTFDFSFTVTNQCGNSLERVNTVTIIDDATVKPFYYVSNTTFSDEDKPPADWSVRHDPTDHEFIIHVTWPIWQTGLSEQFFVLFWYGGFNPEEDPGPADGFVQFSSSSILTGDSVKAYIPLDPIHPPMIGMAAGWTCSGELLLNEEPEAWGIPIESDDPKSSFPLLPGGQTNMLDVSDGPIIIDPSWDGICNDEKLAHRYYYEIDPMNYVQLNLSDDFFYNLYGTEDQEGYNYLSDISWGIFELEESNSITFYDDVSCADIPGYYSFTLNGDTLSFTPYDDYCSSRQQYLTAQKFIQQPDYGMIYDISACPGDKVRFIIAGGISYEWHFGDGATSTEKYPVHSYATEGEYDAFVIATNACGRSDTIHTPVKVSTTNVPRVDFWSDNKGDAARFQPIQFFFNDQWLDQARNNIYLWDFGDGTTSTEPNPIHAYEQDGEYTVTLTVTNGCGSNSKSEMQYIRDAEQLCEAKYDFTVSGDTAFFMDMSIGEPTSWFWDFGDGFTSNKQNPAHKYTFDGIYFVCLSIYDSISDCAHQICKSIEVGTVNCKADFAFAINEATKTVKFTDRSDNITEWFWDFGDGTFSSEPNPSHTYTEPGMYPVCLSTFNSATDCFSDICKEIQIGKTEDTLCYANFTFFVDEANNTLILTDESSNNITDWYWTFSDGTFINERNPAHTYMSPGVYEVCLIVFDKFTGCSAEACKQISIGIAECNVKADFAFFIDMDNNAINFTDRSTGNITNWFWNFGDGTTSSKPNPKHMYANPGYYLVTLSVFDQTKDCADHIAEFVQVGTVDCRANFEYSVDASTNTVTFKDKSRGDITEYFWFFDDGSFSVEKNPVHQYDHPGLYFVELTVVDASGLCMDFFFEPIQVGTIDCRANFNYYIDSTTNTAHFTPEIVGNITDYLWFFGDGAISTNTKPVHQFTMPGYFTVGLNTFDEATGCMDYYEEIILIGREGIDCRADFMYMTDPSTLEVTFTDKSKGNIVEYIWEFGDRTLNTDNVKNPTHTYSTGGYYLVCLTVVNSFGIPNTLCKEIQVAPDPVEDCQAKFIYTIDSANLSVTFTDQSFGKPDGWYWDFGDEGTSAEQNPDHTYSGADYYLVNLSIKNSTSGCTSRKIKLINVGAGNQGLRAGFSYVVDTSNLKAESYPVDFVGTSLGDAGKLKWTFGDGTTDTTTMNPTHEYLNPGVYDVCLTVSNPVTGDENTSCQQVTVGSVGINPLEAWHSLLGNYPNPFTGTTNIVYELPEEATVDLSIFDNTGRKIETLVKDDQPAGRYLIEYDGSALDSGVYHLRLVSDYQVITSMMIVR